MDLSKLATPDGHELRLIQHRSDRAGSRPLVVMCHGITTDKDEDGLYADFAGVLADEGLDSLRFDFRGHGESSLPPSAATVAGMILDLWTVLEALGGKRRPVAILAASFGASIVLNLARETSLRGISALVFWNPLTDYANSFTRASLPWGQSFFPQGGLHAALRQEIFIGDSGFRINPVIAVELYYYKPEQVILRRRLPTLVLHGAQDTVVALADTKAFVARQDPDSTRLIEFAQASHGLGEVRDAAFDATVRFLVEATQ